MKPILFAAILLVSAPALAQQTFRDSGAFTAALNGRDPVVEGFENAPFGTLIPDGSEFGGLTWHFTALTEHQGGLVANTYWIIDTQGLFLERDGAEGPGAGDYFYPGESVTVLFPEPITAVGMFFNVGVFDTIDYIILDTDQGSAYSGGPVSEETIYPGLFFVGLVAEGPIQKAVFTIADFAPTGWNADNLMYLPSGDECYPDFDGDGELTLFDFLGYVNAFNAGANDAECDGDNGLTLFDFLCYVNAFNAGC
jgi:hypothetical protein